MTDPIPTSLEGEAHAPVAPSDVQHELLMIISRLHVIGHAVAAQQGQGAGKYVFAEFDAGIICAARTLLERSVADEEAVERIDTEHRDRRLALAASPSSVAPALKEKAEQLLRLAQTFLEHTEGRQSFRLAASLLIDRDVTDEEVASARLTAAAPSVSVSQEEKQS